MTNLTTNQLNMQFGNIVVNVVNQSSGIFVGQNYQYAWSSHFKTNNGFGTMSGYLNHNNTNTVYIFDNDFIDAPIDDRDVITGNAVAQV